MIQRLKNKWWKKEQAGGTCNANGDSSEDSSGSVSELGLQNVGGIFLVLLLGLVIGCITAGLENFWKKFSSGRKFLT